MLDSDGNDFSIQKESEPVLVWLSNGYIVRTNSLRWSSQEKLIQTDDPVEIVGSKIAIRGEGLQLSLDESNLMVLKDVHAEVY